MSRHLFDVGPVLAAALGVPDDLFELVSATSSAVEVEGGCEECEAVQRLWRDAAGWRVTVLHDVDCERLARITARRAVQ